MKSDRGIRMPSSMVQISWSDSLKKSIYKVFGFLIRCKLIVDQEE